MTQANVHHDLRVSCAFQRRIAVVCQGQRLCRMVLGLRSLTNTQMLIQATQMLWSGNFNLNLSILFNEEKQNVGKVSLWTQTRHLAISGYYQGMFTLKRLKLQLHSLELHLEVENWCTWMNMASFKTIFIYKQKLGGIPLPREFLCCSSSHLGLQATLADTSTTRPSTNCPQFCPVLTHGSCCTCFDPSISLVGLVLLVGAVWLRPCNAPR